MPQQRSPVKPDKPAFLLGALKWSCRRQVSGQVSVEVFAEMIGSLRGGHGQCAHGALERLDDRLGVVRLLHDGDRLHGGQLAVGVVIHGGLDVLDDYLVGDPIVEQEHGLVGPIVVALGAEEGRVLWQLLPDVIAEVRENVVLVEMALPLKRSLLAKIAGEYFAFSLRIDATSFYRLEMKKDIL